jgi:small subunit ribosomal protein S20
MRTQVKKTLEAIAEGDAERAKKELALASQKLDKAAKSNVIHKNQAARRKSRLQRAVNQLSK